MRIVVTGATGNVGTSVLRALSSEPRCTELIAVARRPGARLPERARFVSADVSTSDLTAVFAGADAVIHLAWLIQPGRDEVTTRRVNVDGTERVIEAVLAAGVGSLVYASSVGAYSPGPKDRFVDESWPTDGIASSFYSRHKATVEAMLDRTEHAHPQLRVVRLRPGLIFQRSAASEIRRLFLGPLVPGRLLRARLAPVAPAIPGLVFQAVHADDVADAYRLAAVGDAHGAFNIAAAPVIDPGVIAAMLDARPVHVPARFARAAAAGAYAARLSPVEPGWLDMALAVPLMDTERARHGLGWAPRRSATDAISELVTGLQDGAGGETPPLAARAGGPLRVREFLTGLGARQ